MCFPRTIFVFCSIDKKGKILEYLVCIANVCHDQARSRKILVKTSRLIPGE